MGKNSLLGWEICDASQRILTNVRLRILWDLDEIPKKGTDCAIVFSLMECYSSVDTMDKLVVGGVVTIYTTDTGLLLMIRCIFLSATQYLIFLCSHMFLSNPQSRQITENWNSFQNIYLACFIKLNECICLHCAKNPAWRVHYALEHIKLLLEVSTIGSSRATMHLSILVKKNYFLVSTHIDDLKCSRLQGRDTVKQRTISGKSTAPILPSSYLSESCSWRIHKCYLWLSFAKSSPIDFSLQCTWRCQTGK